MTRPVQLTLTIGGGPAGPFYTVTLNGPELHYESLGLTYADGALHTHGDNNTPPRFDAFLRAVRRLLGGRAFS